ncbi:MAG: isoprenyl transferase [Flavobacteriales bacterium]
MSASNHIDRDRVPKHVAIIMDGNGRWAEYQGKDRIIGHFNGVEAVRESLKASLNIGVKFLTLYAFSTENWNRPKEEVEALMDLLVSTIVNEISELDEQGIRLQAIGDLGTLPDAARAQLKEAVAQTAHNTNITLVLALSYSARWEITRAVKEMMQDDVAPEHVDPETIGRYLATSGIPDPELLIRTSGECRISNFLLWQIAYTELYFTETLWPDFDREAFYAAIQDYQNRERRFGKTSAQITEPNSNA